MPAGIAGSLVFYASGAILVLEILAGRLLAQYVGISLETFTGIIGTVLAGIAAGTWAGGILADRVDPRRLLGPLMTTGGVTVLFVVPIVRALGPGVGADSASIVVLTAAGFLLPAAVLSAVSPTVVKLQLADLGQTGSVVGRLSALGTAGALVGTYITGFVLVAAAPTTTIITIIGVSLVAIGLALWVWLAAGTASSSVTLVAFGGLGAVLSLALDGPCDVESAYHCAEVVVDDDRPSGRLLLLDTARNSYVDLDDPTHLEFTYARAVTNALDAIRPDQSFTSLHIGGGGFTLPAWLRATRPGSTSLVLEIDETLVDIGEDELGLVQDDDLVVDVGDARLAVDDLADDTYDLVIGDAFTGFSVPWHLTTREFVEELDRVMTDDGVYLLNLIDRPPNRFARAEAATLLERFAHVAVLAPPERINGETGGNFVMLASPQPFDAATVAAAIVEPDGYAVAAGPDARAFAEPGEILRDDYAPVDQWRN